MRVVAITRALTSLLLVALLIAGHVPPASAAQTPHAALWFTDGTVEAMLRVNNTLYVTGEYRYVGQNTGGIALVDTDRGAPTTQWPLLEGQLNAIESDGRGGWFVGGAPGGSASFFRSPLIYLPGGNRLLAAAVPPTPDGTVTQLLRNDDTLYVIGTFSTIGGEDRPGFAAVDIPSGRVLPLRLDVAGGQIETLTRYNTTLFIGGTFQQVNGLPRSNVAAIDLNAGVVLPWSPLVDETVVAMVNYRNILYIGGTFTQVDGAPRSAVAAFSLPDGALTPFAPLLGSPLSPQVAAFSVANGRLFVAGTFDTVDGLPRTNLAAFGTTSQQLLEWAPRLSAYGTIKTMKSWNGALYVGGTFTSVNDVPRINLAAIDGATGAVTDWSPQANASVERIRLSGSTLAIVGGFKSSGGSVRQNLAAIDLDTRQVTDWNPSPNGRTTRILTTNNQVFVAGEFTEIAGAQRQHIAAFDSATGELAGWQPHVDVRRIDAMVAAGGALYLGGEFVVNGALRQAVAVSTSTGAVLQRGPQGWATYPDRVGPFRTDGERLFVGFGRSVPNVAAYDLAGGALLATWQVAGSVHNMYVYEDRLFVGADGLDTIDLRTGQVLPRFAEFRPRFNTVAVTGMSVRDGVLYITGDFSAVNNQPRNGTAAFDARTGALLEWAPVYDGNVVATSSSAVYVAGSYDASRGRYDSAFIAEYPLLAEPRP